jgi:hypothetical protein
LTRAGQIQKWRWPWLATTEDGNPILSAIDPQRRIAVRIIQEEPENQGDLDLDWWVDSFGKQSEANAVRELVIACVLSDRTAARIDKLLFDWVVHGQVPLPNKRNNPIDRRTEPTSTRKKRR